ncbi:MAG: methyl-accepting chemotaxis protein [Desulfobacteraceae bacterium]|nr:methyl-accepting chemotaxis protein [Desulfobacteraceae bacterium]
MPSKPRRYSLQRTMIIYFLLIGFASVLVGVEFWADFHRGALKTEIWDNIRHYGQDEQYQEAILAPIDRMRSKAVLMVGIIMLVMVIVLTMFIKNITEPLQHMIRLSEKISSGDLSQTIRVEANNELSDLSNVINEMASNLQEIILLAQRICADGKTFVGDTLQKLQNKPLDEITTVQLEEKLNKIGTDLAMLDEVMAYFSFYSVDKRNDVG